MPGAWCARSRACSVVNTRVSHHGHTGNARHSPRNGFTTYYVLSPVIGLYCHRHRRNCFRQLERQRRGVRTTRLRRLLSRHSSKALSASTASRLTLVTIAKRPSERQDDAIIALIWGKHERKYFLPEIWTPQIKLKRLSNLNFMLK